MSAPRRGPGRPAKADAFAAAIAAAEGKIADKLPHLIGKMLELADGVHVERVLKGGMTVAVYQEKPDFKALEYLINRVMGKPTERREHTGEDGEPIEVRFYIPHNGRDPLPEDRPAEPGPPGNLSIDAG